VIVERVQFAEEINLFGLFTSQLGAENQQPRVELELADRGVKVRFANGGLKGKTILVPYERISGVMLAPKARQ
jgi:hypothetical protein